MKLYICIPTYKRVKKLKRCIESILDSIYEDYKIVVVCDNNDVESVVYVHSLQNDDIETMVQPEHRFVIGAWNRFFLECWDREWDGMIGLCDDVKLKPDALYEAVACHQQNFPDGDGVVGFKQECPGHPNYTFKWFGQTLVGRKFVERFPHNLYCCPDYVHFFQDEEMWQYGSSINKFVNCEKALLYHYHPAFVEEEIDETHNIIRSGKLSPKSKDISTNNIRKQKGLIWGQSSELINEKPNYLKEIIKNG